MSNLKPSNLILKNQIVADDWTLVELPKVDQEVRMQAGKVVLFKLTGENTTTAEQIANTVIPATGKVLVPLSVYLARKSELTSRVKDNEIGIWLATHEVLENLAATEPNFNIFPLIAVYVERFADGRIFSLGNLLRTRYSFNNTLRAFGDVLRDQLFFLKRSGFDSYLIRADRSAEEALQSLKDFTHPYQGAVDNNQPVWRRVHRSV
ncbi:MAG TPA: DUF934 domain-containing protein [Methylotenera sp.]|nr:DUF934 domain-containing protein [Methylotenera sp.]